MFCTVLRSVVTWELCVVYYCPAGMDDDGQRDGFAGHAGEAAGDMDMLIAQMNGVSWFGQGPEAALGPDGSWQLLGAGQPAAVERSESIESYQEDSEQPAAAPEAAPGAAPEAADMEAEGNGMGEPDEAGPRERVRGCPELKGEATPLILKYQSVCLCGVDVLLLEGQTDYVGPVEMGRVQLALEFEGRRPAQEIARHLGSLLTPGGVRPGLRLAPGDLTWSGVMIEDVLGLGSTSAVGGLRAPLVQEGMRQLDMRGRMQWEAQQGGWACDGCKMAGVRFALVPVCRRGCEACLVRTQAHLQSRAFSRRYTPAILPSGVRLVVHDPLVPPLVSRVADLEWLAKPEAFGARRTTREVTCDLEVLQGAYELLVGWAVNNQGRFPVWPRELKGNGGYAPFWWPVERGPWVPNGWWAAAADQ